MEYSNAEIVGFITCLVVFSFIALIALIWHFAETVPAERAEAEAKERAELAKKIWKSKLSAVVSYCERRSITTVDSDSCVNIIKAGSLKVSKAYGYNALKLFRAVYDIYKDELQLPNRDWKKEDEDFKALVESKVARVYTEE